MQTDQLAAIRERLAKCRAAHCPYEPSTFNPGYCRQCGESMAMHFYARDVTALLAEVEKHAAQS